MSSCQRCEDVRDGMDRIHEEVRSLSSRVVVLSARYEADMEQRERYRNDIQKNIERIDYVLSGNGKPGLIEEVRSMKQTQSGFVKVAWTAGTAAIGAVVTAIWNLLRA